MYEIKWYFPGSIDEALDLIKLEGVIPHAGGTGILKSRLLEKIKGLVDLGKLSINYFCEENGEIKIGAMQTYGDVIENLQRIDPDSILIKALSQAASTPLRNRITVGGSVSYFPVWSDIMGPLIALDASVTLLGENAGIYNIRYFANNRLLRRNSLVKEVKFKKDRWKSYYFRAVRTSFDYAAFTISILAKKNKNLVKDMRIVVTGCAGKFNRLEDLEEKLKGKETQDLNLDDIVKDINLEFIGKRHGSPEYLNHLFQVELARGLSQIFRD